MLQHLLERVVKVGRLTVYASDWKTIVEVGQPADAANLVVAVRLNGALTPLKLAFNPDLYLGEAYMNGQLELVQGSLWDLLELIGRNMENRPASVPWMASLGRWFRGQLARSISLKSARRNAAHHYDLSFDLYSLFLDADLQYSCAYFQSPAVSLDDAQAAKKRHITAKLLLKPGQRILDIGCGWGGLAISLAQAEDVQVTGITLSEEQLKVCRIRAREAGLDQRVTFELCDYRQVTGDFDRIVSVGMFEHVGSASYDTFFRTVSGLLTADGLALLHTIGHRERPFGITNPWLDKYIFPGGYVPSASELTSAIEGAGLWLTDLEVLRLHYAETLRRWRERFMDRASVARDLYDERFVRMWEFYLAGCEMSFRFGALMVMQAQLTKKVDAAPWTRDYMVDVERALATVFDPGEGRQLSAS